MPRSRTLKRTAEILVRFARIKKPKLKRAATTTAMIGGLGAAGGFFGGSPGHRGASAREGAVGSLAAAAAGVFVFRRIRGRVVRIRKR